jgi:SWI/SNF-related matrix-associated actin-dependent regulator 1 of chromatin subfamily A
MEFQIQKNNVVLKSAVKFTEGELKIINELTKLNLISLNETNQEISVNRPFDENVKKIIELTKLAQLPPELLEFANKEEDEKFDQIEPPKELNAKMLEHQIKAFNFCCRREKSLIALAMGLGKTLVAIASILHENKNRTVVVCPAALKSNWSSELAKFAPSLKTLIVNSTKHYQKNFKDENIQVFIISFSLLDFIKTELKSNPFNMIIADEAHYIKSSQAKRSKAFSAIAKTSEKLILLTGTPGESHADLFNLLKIVNPQLFKYFHHFDTRRSNAPNCSTRLYYAERYCLPEIQHVIGGKKVFIFKKSQRPDELKHVMSSSVLAMKKEDVLNLPELQRQKIILRQLSSKKKKFFTTEMSKIETLREQKGSLLADSALMELVRETMRVKAHDVCQYLKMILSSTTEKIILFFHHKELRETIKETLLQLKIDFISVDGSTPMKSRAGLYERFEKEESCQVGMLSLQACSTGLNFQFVSLIVFAELLFSSNTHCQAEARSHRIGQKNKVVCQYLVLNGTTDEIIWRSLIRKSNVQNVLMSKESSEECSNVWTYDNVSLTEDEEKEETNTSTKAKKPKKPKKKKRKREDLTEKEEDEEELVPLKTTKK